MRRSPKLCRGPRSWGATMFWSQGLTRVTDQQNPILLTSLVKILFSLLTKYRPLFPVLFMLFSPHHICLVECHAQDGKNPSPYLNIHWSFSKNVNSLNELCFWVAFLEFASSVDKVLSRRSSVCRYKNPTIMWPTKLPRVTSIARHMDTAKLVLNHATSESSACKNTHVPNTQVSYPRTETPHSYMLEKYLLWHCLQTQYILRCVTALLS